MARPVSIYCNRGHNKLETGMYADRRCKKCHQEYIQIYRITTDRNKRERERRRLARAALREARAKEQRPRVQVTWE